MAEDELLFLFLERRGATAPSGFEIDEILRVEEAVVSVPVVRPGLLACHHVNLRKRRQGDAGLVHQPLSFGRSRAGRQRSPAPRSRLRPGAAGLRADKACEKPDTARWRAGLTESPA